MREMSLDQWSDAFQWSDALELPDVEPFVEKLGGKLKEERTLGKLGGRMVVYPLPRDLVSPDPLYPVPRIEWGP